MATVGQRTTTAPDAGLGFIWCAINLPPVTAQSCAGSFWRAPGSIDLLLTFAPY